MNARLKNTLIYLVSGILLVFLLLVFILAPRREDKVCTEVVISVVDKDVYNFIDESDVAREMERLGVDLRGKEFSEISLVEIEKLLEEHPMMGNVICYRSGDGNISIDVEQKAPMFRVITPRETYYVDSERRKMPIKLNCAAYVPVVSGDVDINFAKEGLYDFVQHIQDDSFMNALTEQICVNSKNEIELIPRVGKFRINFGTVDRCNEKIEKLKTFYKEVLPEVGWDKYTKINLEFVDKVVAS